MRRKRPNWPWLFASSIKLGLDANKVIGLRLEKLVHGDAAARAESRLMIDEKIKAAVEANFAAAHSILIGQPHLAPKRALSVYKKRVRKNLRRLKK
ncbi:MAG TPA: hypothetical protein VED87_06720 [Methylocystis sp.]|nr:hypothetical protein [Methylocystis sp.]